MWLLVSYLKGVHRAALLRGPRGVVCPPERADPDIPILIAAQAEYAKLK